MTTTEQITSILDDVKRLSDEATKGPFEPITNGTVEGQSSQLLAAFKESKIGVFKRHEDRDFFFSARTSNPNMEAALRVALVQIEHSHICAKTNREFPYLGCRSCETLSEILTLLSHK